MESQIYYRPTDLATAKYLAERLGERSAFAHSSTTREGAEVSAGLMERPIPLLTAQHILQMKDQEVLAFHRRLPPLRIQRIDWRHSTRLSQRRERAAPQLSPLPEIPQVQEQTAPASFSHIYIDPDE